MHKRIDYIDIAKGIGILLVYIGHCEIGEGNITNLIRWIYSFHMPLFFFISGVLFSDKYIPVQTFYRNKFASLIVPYFIFSILNYGLLKLFHIGVSFDFIMRGWGTNPLWFIPILFLANVVHYHITWSKWSLKIPVVFALLLLLVWKANTNGWLPYSVSELPWFYLCFMSGYLMKGTLEKSESLKFNWALGSVGLVILSVVLFRVAIPYNVGYLHQDGNVYCWMLKYALGIIGTLSTLLISMSLSRTKILKIIFLWLGLNSLVIMCTHKLFYVILQTINYQPFLRGGYNHIIIWILIVLSIYLYNKLVSPYIKRIHS